MAKPIIAICLTQLYYCWSRVILSKIATFHENSFDLGQVITRINVKMYTFNCTRHMSLAPDSCHKVSSSCNFSCMKYYNLWTYLFSNISVFTFMVIWQILKGE